MGDSPLKVISQHPETTPSHAGVPMGFMAEASRAQAYNKAKITEILLPLCIQLVNTKLRQTIFPIWHSILDNI